MGRRRRVGLLTQGAKLSSTKDWILHRLHGLLGLYVLCHFIYRFYIFFVVDNYNNNNEYDDGDNDDMGFRSMSSYSNFLLVFLPHFILQVSGFGFHIPRKRHPDGNRIWPEYRWHALIFFCRCMSLMLVAFWTSQKNKKNKKHDDESYGDNSYDCFSWFHDDKYCFKTRYFLNLLIVLITSVAADSVTRYYKQFGESSSTIRQLNGPRGILYLMSVAQFHATVHCLLTTDKLAVQVAALTVVQTSAFGMTLRRKGIITLVQGLMLYAFVLILGMCVIIHDLQKSNIKLLFWKAILIGNVSAMLRMDLGVSKYILWPSVAVLLTWITSSEPTTNTEQQQEGEEEGENGNDVLLWVYFSRISTMILLCNAIRRQVVVNVKMD